MKVRISELNKSPNSSPAQELYDQLDQSGALYGKDGMWVSISEDSPDIYCISADIEYAVRSVNERLKSPESGTVYTKKIVDPIKPPEKPYSQYLH